ncbi:unnamed protein product [Mesocestoides corti]|uniref:Uncharacterized protein n=1 Tax=Mesocestoides corti TaxID=53468 RepID=A0A0R3UEV1_MESCO|nr:unnamed protein product [Mesocestoides corti]
MNPDEETVRSRFNIDPCQQLEDFHFRETRSDIQSSVILLSQRVKRQYMSEFVLPDDTRIAVSRIESSLPVDQKQEVLVNLAVRHPSNSFLPKFVTTLHREVDDSKSDIESSTTLETSEDATTDSEIEKFPDKFSGSINLRISDYLGDDAWAANILEWNSGASGDLLRHLEADCRLDPDSYRMERLQRRRNLKTVVDIQQEPQTRNLDIGRKENKTDSTPD